MLVSCATVAFAFGLSFYYALVSSQTAVARQFPELESVVARLKSMLVVNTFGFVAVVVLSFWILSRLASSRMFTPLGRVMAGVRKVSENRIPEMGEDGPSGPFSDFESSFARMVESLRANESEEIDELKSILDDAGISSEPETRERIERLIALKKSRLGLGRHPDASSGGRGSGEEVFMQPV